MQNRERQKPLKTGGEFVQSYDKLLIAAGSRPIVPPVEAGAQGVYVLKTIPRPRPSRPPSSRTRPSASQ